MSDPCEAWLLKRACAELSLSEDELRMAFQQPETKELITSFIEGGKFMP